MSKVVVFDIRDGDFERGFAVTLRIRREDGNDYRVEEGSFPAAPNIPQLYRNFQRIYKSLGERAIECEANQITNVSTIKELEEAANALEDSLKKWFQHLYIEQLRIWVESEIYKEESARIIFLTNNEILKKLPWHLWQLFQNYDQAWFSLGTKYNVASEPLKCPVNILAILGSDKQINLTPDEKILTNLPGAKVKALKQPTREELCSQLRDNSWDILCFAGHSITSSDGNDGVFQLNNTDNPSLQNLRNAFKKAIKSGLKLAIFNSCDGLGLASKLTQLGIPQVIVMREPVPDEVAQKFLQEFLRLFSQGEKFHLAMRKAQEKLDAVEDKYPYASWLPVICQNPSEKSLTWRQPINVKIERSIRKLWHRKTYTVIVRCMLAGLLVSLFGTSVRIVINYYFIPPSRLRDKAPEVVTDSVSPANDELNKRFSFGERLLLNQSENNNIKQQGADAFSKKEWDNAINYFSKHLEKVKNDPEALVYLNNAIAMKKGNPVKIAVAVQVTEKPGEDEEILRGVAHAQSEYNCGSINNIKNVIQTKKTKSCSGIPGQPLLIEIANDSGQENVARKIANYIVNGQSQNKILAVIGHRTSKLTLDTVKNVYKNNILVITPTGNSTNFDNNTFHHKVLRTVVNNSYEIYDFYKYLTDTKKINLKTNAIFLYKKGEAFGDSLGEELKIKSNESDIMNIDYRNMDDYNANEILDLARENKVKVIILAPPSNQEALRKTLEIVKLVSDNKDYKDIILLGASTLCKPLTISTDLSANFGKASQTSNLVVSTPWHRSNSDFERKAKEIWGTSQINWVTAMSYDATKVVIKGLEKFVEQPNNKLSKQFRDYLLSDLTHFYAEGATAEVQFSEKGGRKRDETHGLGVLVQVKCSDSSCNFENIDTK